MIDSDKIKKCIMSSDEVVITSHKNIDLDAIGSMLGMYYIANLFNKNAYLVIEDENMAKEVKRSLQTIKESDKIITSTYEDVKNKINNKTLLIITDVNKKSRIQNEKLLKINNKILIDHHIKSEDALSDLLYEYVDINESSTTEIIMKLVDELNIYIPSYIATIMLSGIYIDTNGFMLKTSESTHICAANLYKFGADNIEAQYLLKQNFEEFKRRQKIISNTEFYNTIGIAVEDKLLYQSTELAKASDVILTFNEVEVSFAIAKLDEDTIGISARSLGNIDVEKIMTTFGGGGHKLNAAAQIKNLTVEEIKEKLLKYLGVK